MMRFSNLPAAIARFVLVAALTFSLEAAQPAHAQEGPFGRIAEILPQSGQDGPWGFTNTGDSFGITNTTNPDPIRYYYAGTKDGEEGRRVVEASLAVHPDSNGSAGLLYGLSPDGSFYHALTLGPTGVVTLFRRDDDGFRAMLELENGAYAPNGQNRLRIEEEGNAISYFLNGAKLGEIGGGSMGRGFVGIVAVGAVRAVFDGFSVDAGDSSGLTQPAARRTADASGTAQDALRLQPLTIEDTTGPFGRVAAYRTLIPAGWTVEGGITWSPATGCFRGPGLGWSTASPDRRYSVTFLPPVNWAANNLGQPGPGCLQMDLPTAEAAMQGYLQSLPTGDWQAVSAEKPEELRPLYEAIMSGIPMTQMPNTRRWADWTVLRTRGSYEGEAYEQAVIGVTIHAEMRMSDVTGAAMVSRIGNTAFVLVLTTPAGELERGHPAFAPILSNFRPDPRWMQAVAQWRASQSRPTPGNGATAGSAGTEQSVGDMMFESWKRRNAMDDAGQSRTVNSIMEVQPWQSSSGPILLSQNYNNAWELGDGSIVMTNNANFNPMQSFGQTGAAMSVMR